MQPSRNDPPGPPAFPGRPVSPFAAVPPQAKPPPTLPPQGFHPGPAPAPQPPYARSPSPVGFTGPSSPPPPTSFSSYPRPPLSTSQPGSPPLRCPFTSPQVPHGASFPGSQMQSVPMGFPPQGPSPTTLGGYMSPPPPRGTLPPPPIGASAVPPPRGYAGMPPSTDASYQPLRPAFQQPFTTGPVSRPPPPLDSSPFHGGVPLGGPPLSGTLQGLVEEFQSLSVGSAPGSVDPGVDPASLPRPLDGDPEPKSVAETYPLNCDSRYLRLTTHAIPSSQSLYARWHLPVGAVVHPLAEAPDGEEVPIVNFGPAGVVRCRRCRTYINPYATFTDGGRKWRCNLCSLLNDVPGEYFCSLDASGRRLDADQRPELIKGSVEFVAPTEYMVRPPMPPLYFFIIDVSLPAVQCGMLEVVAKTIKSCLDDLPGFPRTQIGFITFDSTLHFYNLKVLVISFAKYAESSLTQPQMMVVADLDDIFAPIPDDLLVNLSDSRNVVDAFLDSLPTMFQGNLNVESALGPALKAAFMVMSQLGGKLIVFQTTLPSLGVGRLKLRGDDPRIYGSDKEHTLRLPEDPFYKQMAAEFTKYQIGVDVFAFSDRYIDIASLGSLTKYTGGQMYYYPSFLAEIHHEKLRHDLSRDLTRETAWEAVMRIRCGKGVRFTSYHGHFMLRSTDLLALPAVDCDKAFAMQLSLEETLLTTQTVYFQVALLYTSSSGERRIRVHTAAAPVVTDLTEVYRHADTGAIVSLLGRLAIEKSLSHKLEEARQLIQLRIIKSLKEYRNLYVVQHRLGGRLIYPESLKLLPLYGLALCKSLALRGGYADAQLDERCAAGYAMMILPIKRIMKLLYPNLLKIDDAIVTGKFEVDDLKDSLKSLPLTSSALDSKAVYVLDDGLRFVIWFGRMLLPDFISDILGIDSSVFSDLSKVGLIETNAKASNKLVKLLRKLREKDLSCHQLCQFVRQGEQPRESMLFLYSLVEDQIAGTAGYVDWILQLYRQVQQNP